MINDTGDLGLRRGLEHLEELSVQARDLNRRMVDAFACRSGLCPCEPSLRAGRATYPAGRSEGPALRFGDPRVMALAGALCALVHTITGFTNRSLRAQVSTLLDTTYTTGQMSYDPTRLRLKGLIARATSRSPRPAVEPDRNVPDHGVVGEQLSGPAVDLGPGLSLERRSIMLWPDVACEGE